jgi:hypothetical protein
MRPQVGCRPVIDHRRLRLSNHWHLEVEVGVIRRCTHLSHHQLAQPMDFRVVTPVCVPLVTTVVRCFVPSVLTAHLVLFSHYCLPACLTDWLNN